MRILNQMLAIVNGGVIDNKQSGSGVPSNSYTQTTAITNDGKILIITIIGIIIISVWIFLFWRLFKKK